MNINKTTVERLRDAIEDLKGSIEAVEEDVETFLGLVGERGIDAREEREETIENLETGLPEFRANALFVAEYIGRYFEEGL